MKSPISSTKAEGISDEEHRHRCEVREWIKRGLDKGEGFEAWWHDMLNGKTESSGKKKSISEMRGKAAATHIDKDLREQIRKGNRGDWGVWL